MLAKSLFYRSVIAAALLWGGLVMSANADAPSYCQPGKCCDLAQAAADGKHPPFGPDVIDPKQWEPISISTQKPVLFSLAQWYNNHITCYYAEGDLAYKSRFVVAKPKHESGDNWRSMGAGIWNCPGGSIGLCPFFQG